MYKGGVNMDKIRLNDDAELVADIRQRLKENNGFCPCRITKNVDTLCICREFREQESGECHCGLYIKE
jgi:ferredoxin-thioredoxin reductase catalytic subunit